MKNLRLAALFGVTAVLAQACGQQAAKTPDSPAPSASAIPASAVSSVFTGLDTSATDWKTDPALADARQLFGVPNQAVVLNPNAFNVAQTASAADVQKILPDQLIIGAQHAAWLLARNPGDVLYCGVSCGDKGFLRRIVGLHLVGGTVVVDTKVAGLTDIVISGWIHGRGTLPDPFNPGATPSGTLVPTVPLPGAPATGTTPAPRDEKTGTNKAGGDYKAELGGGGTLETTATISSEFIFDMVVTAVPVSQIIPNPTCTRCYNPTTGSCYTCDAQWVKVKAEQGALIALFPTLGGDAPQLSYFRIELDPSVECEVTLGVYAEVEQPLFNKKLYESGPITIAPMEIGPVELNWTFDVNVEATVSIGGKISLNGSTSNTYSAKLGMQYTSSGGWAGIASGSRDHKASFNAKGEAAMKAEVDLAPDIGVTIYSIVGPVFGPFAGAGAEVKIEKDLAKACPPPELEVDAFVDYGVQAGFEVKFFPFYTVWTHEVTDQLWTNTIEWEIYKTDLPWPPGESSGCVDAGTPDAGTPDAGAKDGGASDAGAGSDGGSVDAGNVNCNSSSDCTGTFGKCAVCIVVPNICPAESGVNFCSTDPSDTLSMTCSSTADCDPCGTGGMTCASCSSVATGCGGNCCQFQ